jgi:hypothetical protein
MTSLTQCWRPANQPQIQPIPVGHISDLEDMAQAMAFLVSDRAKYWIHGGMPYLPLAITHKVQMRHKYGRARHA